MPSSENDNLVRVQQLMAEGRYQEAYEKLRQSVSADGNDPDLLLAMGWLRLYMEKLDDSITVITPLESQLDQLPKVTVADYHHLKAMQAVKKNQFSEAYALFGQAMQSDPKNSRIYYNWAKAYRAQAGVAQETGAEKAGAEKALTVLLAGEKANATAAQTARYQGAFCTVYYQLKQYPQAIIRCRKAAELTFDMDEREELQDFTENLTLLNKSGAKP